MAMTFILSERATIFTASQNKTEWFKLLDQRYEQLQKPASWQRTVRWIAAYAGHPKKVEQYFRKLNLAKLEKEGFLRHDESAVEDT